MGRQSPATTAPGACCILPWWHGVWAGGRLSSSLFAACCLGFCQDAWNSRESLPEIRSQSHIVWKMWTITQDQGILAVAFYPSGVFISLSVSTGTFGQHKRKILLFQYRLEQSQYLAVVTPLCKWGWWEAAGVWVLCMKQLGNLPAASLKASHIVFYIWYRCFLFLVMNNSPNGHLSVLGYGTAQESPFRSIVE